MTIWAASVGEILDLAADALICSANPQLNLSGGVGGGFLLHITSNDAAAFQERYVWALPSDVT